MPQLQLLDPTSPKHADLLHALVTYQSKKQKDSKLVFLSADKIHKFTYQGKRTKVYLPYSVAQFKSPKDTNDSTLRLAVFEPSTLGAGSYGGVSPVLGLWKYSSKGQKYKTHKQYVIKIMHSANKIADYLPVYKNEQHIAQHVPHLNAKYEVGSFENEYLFLLMRRIPGIPLSNLIHRMQCGEVKLTVVELLRITLEMLDALKSQAHKLHFVSNRNYGHIVHRDIKPLNMIVTKKNAIKLIDFGLSVHSSVMTKSEQIGTYKYMEPQLLVEGASPYMDEESDLFSMAISICELWGANFRKKLKNKDTLIQDLRVQNKNIQLDGLFFGITQLTDKERTLISNLLFSMTRFDRSERKPYQVIYSAFNEILDARLHAEHIEIRKLTIESIRTLTSEQLFNYLKSDDRNILLNTIKGNKKLLSSMLGKLRPILHLLDETTLTQLAQVGMDFSLYPDLGQLICNKKISVEKVELLHAHGAPIASSVLTYLLENTEVSLNNKEMAAYWIKMCRYLVKVTPDGALILTMTIFNTPFKHAFCRYLAHETQYNEETCVRLLMNDSINREARAKIIGHFVLIQNGQLLPSTIINGYEQFINRLKANDELLNVDPHLPLGRVLDKLLTVSSQWYEHLNQSSDNQARNELLQATKTHIDTIWQGIFTKKRPSVRCIDQLVLELQQHLSALIKVDDAFLQIKQLQIVHYPKLYKDITDKLNSAYTDKKIHADFLESAQSNESRFTMITGFVSSLKLIRQHIHTHSRSNNQSAFVLMIEQYLNKFENNIDIQTIIDNNQQLLHIKEAFALYQQLISLRQQQKQMSFDSQCLQGFAQMDKRCEEVYSSLKYDDLIHFVDFGYLAYSIFKDLEKLQKIINHIKPFAHPELLRHIYSLCEITDERLSFDLSALDILNFQKLNEDIQDFYRYESLLKEKKGIFETRRAKFNLVLQKLIRCEMTYADFHLECKKLSDILASFVRNLNKVEENRPKVSILSIYAKITNNKILDPSYSINLSA